MSWFSDEVAMKKIPDQKIRSLIHKSDEKAIVDAIFRKFTLFAEVLHFLNESSLVEKIFKVIFEFL